MYFSSDMASFNQFYSLINYGVNEDEGSLFGFFPLIICKTLISKQNHYAVLYIRTKFKFL